jgi:filamentous hemagglutinin
MLSYQQSTSLLQNWLFGAGDGTYDIAGMASAFNQIGGVGSMRAGREAASALVLRGLIESGLPVDVIMQRLDFASSATFGQAYSADELARQGVDPNRKLWDSPALSGSADVVAIWAAVGPSRFGSAVRMTDVSNIGANSASSFASEAKLASHFSKHGAEFKVKTVDEYLQVGRDVMQQGQRVEYAYMGETRTGYVQFMGNTRSGEAKFAFVGTNTEGAITTIHVERARDLFKLLNGNKADTTIRMK